MPIIDPGPLEPHDHPPSPIRDDRALGPTEDLDREPDGIPHALIGLGVLVLLLLAATSLVVISGQITTARGAALLVLFACAALAALLVMIAKRWRKPNQPHASR